MASKQAIPEIDIEELRQQRREARRQRRKRRQRARIILWGTIGSSILLLGLMGFTFLRIQAAINIYNTYPPLTASIVMQGRVPITFIHISPST